MSVQLVNTATAPAAAPSVRPHSGAEPVRPAVPAPAPAITDEQLERAMQALRAVVEPVARNLQFSLDQETGKTVVRVVDSRTQEVIRQIPSEEMLDIARAIDRLEGRLLDREA